MHVLIRMSSTCTFIAIAKMKASNTCIQTVPCVITDSAPLVVVADLHSSLRRWWSSTSKPYGSIGTAWYQFIVSMTISCTGKFNTMQKNTVPVPVAVHLTAISSLWTQPWVILKEQSMSWLSVPLHAPLATIGPSPDPKVVATRGVAAASS